MEALDAAVAWLTQPVVFPLWVAAVLVFATVCAVVGPLSGPDGRGS